MEPDLSTWRKTGPFYFALTRTGAFRKMRRTGLAPARRDGLNGILPSVKPKCGATWVSRRGRSAHG
jgi:hypothetical protein